MVIIARWRRKREQEEESEKGRNKIFSFLGKKAKGLKWRSRVPDQALETSSKAP